jgi:hypothetical protein
LLFGGLGSRPRWMKGQEGGLSCHFWSLLSSLDGVQRCLFVCAVDCAWHNGCLVDKHKPNCSNSPGAGGESPGMCSGECPHVPKIADMRHALGMSDRLTPSMGIEPRGGLNALKTSEQFFNEHETNHQITNHVKRREGSLGPRIIAERSKKQRGTANMAARDVADKAIQERERLPTWPAVAQASLAASEGAQSSCPIFFSASLLEARRPLQGPLGGVPLRPHQHHQLEHRRHR